MNRFILTVDATTTFSGGNAPVLEILIGGVPVSSQSMSSGTGTYSFLLDFTGSFPSSLSLRFDGSSGDPGDTIDLTGVRVNGQALNTATDLTATLLMQGNSSTVDAAGNDHLFGRVEPTQSDLGTATINGTGSDDNLQGSDSDEDIIDGSGGDDRIRGMGSDDAINGGAGNDTIFGEADNDIVIAGSGNDLVFGGTGDDLLYGEGDNDTLIGGSGDDVLNGGAGDDGLLGDAGDDILYGEAGADWLIGGAGDDSLYGDDGNDTIIGGADNDTIYGGNNDDQLHGDAGNDTIEGEAGADLITGGTGDDTIDGGAGNDEVYGGDGVDVLSGGADNDIVLGGDGADTLNGDSGVDALIGGNGADILDGGTGDDRLHGHGLDAATISSILFSNPNVVYSEDTGSFYEYVNTNTTWSAANTAANAATLNGVSGHLVTVTSQVENDFVQSLMDAGESVWTSGSDAGGGQVWTWNSGVEAGTQFWQGQSGGSVVNNMYENWQAGEPNATNAFVRLQESSGEWTDRAGSDNFDYVIEWEGGLFSDDNAIDTIDGGDGDDWIYGYGGNDVLDGEADNDILFGGAGNDAINGGAGDDAVSGGTGNDTLYGDSAATVVVMESGRTSVTQTGSTQWHSVSFTGIIQNPVVKMFAEDITGDPFTLRVRDITNTGFEFQLDEYDYQDGSTALENLSWIAVASGSYTLDNGIAIEAGFTTATNENTTSVSFSSSFTSPVVFSQISSDNELSAVATRNDNVTGSGFDVQMQEEEANSSSHATEDIGWIVMEAGGSVATGMLVGTTGDNVTHSTSTINFGGTFAATPAFLADMQTTDGGDTASVGGASATSTTQAQVFIDEEESNDGETSHTTENVGYVALEEGEYEAQVVISGSDFIYGNDDEDELNADGAVDTNLLTPSAGNLLATMILGDSPDAYWDLNETSGTTADNQGSIGSSVDGTIIGGATLNSGALYTNGGTSIDFDGSNDGILIPDHVGINTGTYAERTVELVFDADDVTTRQVLFEEGATVNGLTIYLDGGNLYITGEDDGDWADANINASVSTGTTYHVAFVFDQPNNSFTGYLDGVSIGSVTVNNAIFPAHSGDIGIGYAPDGVQFHDGEDGSGGYYFDGRISDVALYNVALSATDIQERADIVQGNAVAADPIDDVLYGGDGFDELFGGDGGRDVFVFENVSAFNDVDQINGFDIGEQDAIDVSDILTGYTPGVSDINDFVTVTNSGGNSIVAVDANGTVGGASFSNIVQINGVTDLNADMLLTNNSLIPV